MVPGELAFRLLELPFDRNMESCHSFLVIFVFFFPLIVDGNGFGGRSCEELITIECDCDFNPRVRGGRPAMVGFDPRDVSGQEPGGQRCSHVWLSR